ncbi:hypothetical protein LSH36_119g13030 [Paralvinella palmiformis]|uniref:Mon2 C-terminal domain-containing protein n=1 Tax=Paralvinella palmiformis TaxID=53620 RepID=A0AAD9JYK4_9ANNE|nr:hypothetical protein LSH36_119g13030 [Paralvinella palmiformis]
MKYGCPSQSSWMLAINSLLTVLNIGLPIARKQEIAFHSMWIELGRTLEEFLFSQHPAPATLSVEDYQRDEAIDCQVIQLIRNEILPYAKCMPREFIVCVMNILNRGSIHSATSAFIDTKDTEPEENCVDYTESSHKLREEFAKMCFETLLQFSFITKQDGKGEEGSITKLAVSSLLQRCKEVLTKYIEDERLSGRCPLPRPRMTEMSFVLKAIMTLLVTLKKTSPAQVDKAIWTQVIDLYPALVSCTTSTSPQVCTALRDALQEYSQLLTPPGQKTGTRNDSL